MSISVLGFELEHARTLLEAAGYTVTVQEVRSRKGLEGNERRVVRQRFLGEERVDLTYAVFKTVIE